MTATHTKSSGREKKRSEYLPEQLGSRLDCMGTVCPLPAVCVTRMKLRKHRKNDMESFRKMQQLKRDFERVKELMDLVRRR